MAFQNRTLAMIPILAAALIIAHCGEDDDGGTNPQAKDCTINNGKAFELINPTSSDTFHVGDTVQIEYRVDSDSVSGVLVFVTLDFGVTYTGLNPKEQFDIADGEERYRCKTFSWVIGSEPSPIDYDATNRAILKFEDYQAGFVKVAFLEDAFTILNP